MDKKFVTKEELKRQFGWSESTFKRRKAEGLVQDYKLGDSRPYYNPSEIESKFQPVAMREHKED